MSQSQGPTPPPPYGPPPGQAFPPLYFPPPPMMYPPPQRQGGGFARAIFTTLAVSVLGFSLTLNIYLLLANGLFSAPTSGIDRNVMISGDAQNQIAVLPIRGAITESTAAKFRELLKDAADDATIKAIVIDLNSPGGTVTASDDIYNQILDYKRIQNKPVYLSMGELATSGGYYVACAADHVVANRTTWTGNIGVLMPRFGLAKLGEKWGIEDKTITSTGSDFKNAGSMFKDDTPEQLAYWQGLIDEAFGVFKAVIVTGRGLDAKTVNALANGKVYSGPEALKLKLVDSLGDLEDTVAAAATKVGIAKPNVVRFDRHQTFMERLSGSEASEGKFASVKIGDAELKIDRGLAENVLAPRPLYMWIGN